MDAGKAPDINPGQMKLHPHVWVQPGSLSPDEAANRPE
jgi:hypothetical protein